MWIKASGELSENVFQLVTAASSHLLFVGEEAALVDAGIAALGPELIEELSRYLQDPEQLRYLLITHSHFDHIGGIGALLDYNPKLEIIAAPASAEVLHDRRQLGILFAKNCECAAAIESGPELDEERWCSCVKVHRILGDGDSLDLGDGVEVKLIASPGHTDDSVAYYAKSDAALAAGEAVGDYRGRDKIYSCFMSSYESYLESLERLSSLDVRVLGFPHAGAITGELPGKFLVSAHLEAERFAGSIRERLSQGELVDEICRELLAEWAHGNISPDGPFVSSQSECLRRMVELVAQGK